MFLKIQPVALVLLLIILSTGTVKSIDHSKAAAPLLDRIAIGEGTTDDAAHKHGLANAYDITYAYGKYSPSETKPPTKMTIGEVKQLQQQMLENQADNQLKSSAVGKYQLLYNTLVDQQKVLGLSDDTIFNEEIQDKIGLSLLEKRGFNKWINGKMTDHDFQKKFSEGMGICC